MLERVCSLQNGYVRFDVTRKRLIIHLVGTSNTSTLRMLLSLPLFFFSFFFWHQWSTRTRLFSPLETSKFSSFNELLWIFRRRTFGNSRCASLSPGLFKRTCESIREQQICCYILILYGIYQDWARGCCLVIAIIQKSWTIAIVVSKIKF